MAIPTKVRNRKQVPARSISVVHREADTLLLEIFDGRKAEPTYYFATPIPSDWGTAFKVERQGEHDTDESYDVLLDGHNSSCTCKGFTYHARDCKHVAGLKALAQRGLLPGTMPASLREVDGPFIPGRSDEPSYDEDIFYNTTHCGCRSSDEHEALCLQPQLDADYNAAVA
ncbi:MAG: SWIM zinc finger family protein [Planctomycetia bacterium]|nr:SWIM zinc finger family protein [Planctomycetia bacterium]